MAKITKDYIDNFAKPPLSPWMSGEQAEITSAAIQQASGKDDVEGPGEHTWNEPVIQAPERSLNTVVFQSKNGGNTIVINDEGSDGQGFMLITHNSGSVVQIDSNGTVLIKSFGDTYNVTEGLQYQKSEGDTNVSVGGEWNIIVAGGAKNVFVSGDVNIECENYNVTARGRVRFNAGEAIELKGAKFSMEGHTDNMDLVVKNLKINASETISLVAGTDMYFSAKNNVHLRSEEGTFVQAGTNINMTSAENTIMKSASTQVKSDDIRLTSSGDVGVKGSGSIHLSGSRVNADDLVYLGAGQASPAEAEDAAEADVGATASTASMPDPPDRRPSTNTDKGITKVKPTNPSISSSSVDDLE